jgi:hypothetical protein
LYRFNLLSCAYNFLFVVYIICNKPVSSVSIVSISMLDDRKLIDWSSRGFSVLPYPDRMLEPPISWNIIIWGLSSGTKRPESKTNPTNRYQVLSVRIAGAISLPVRTIGFNCVVFNTEWRYIHLTFMYITARGANLLLYKNYFRNFIKLHLSFVQTKGHRKRIWTKIKFLKGFQCILLVQNVIRTLFCCPRGETWEFGKTTTPYAVLYVECIRHPQ